MQVVNDIVCVWRLHVYDAHTDNLTCYASEYFLDTTLNCSRHQAFVQKNARGEALESHSVALGRKRSETFPIVSGNSAKRA